VTWVVILAVGAGSLAFRLAPLLLLNRVSLAPRSDRMVRDAGLAAIVALIAVSARQSATSGGVVPVLLAMAVGLMLAARGASMTFLLVCGGAAYAAALVALQVAGR
jgi:branched-subunit amino acid transport protein